MFIYLMGRGFSASIALFLILFFQPSPVFPGIRERVVASVDDDAITLGELDGHHAAALKNEPAITRREALERLINSLLLLREARKLKIESVDDEHLIEEYINLKIRPLVSVTDEEAKEFYGKNKDKFKGAEYKTVKKEIEAYLREASLNRRLKKQLEDLKTKARINILPIEE